MSRTNRNWNKNQDAEKINRTRSEKKSDKKRERMSRKDILNIQNIEMIEEEMNKNN